MLQKHGLGAFGQKHGEAAFENAGFSSGMLGRLATAFKRRLQRAVPRQLERPDGHVAVDGHLDGCSSRLGGRRHFPNPVRYKSSTNWFGIFAPPGGLFLVFLPMVLAREDRGSRPKHVRRLDGRGDFLPTRERKFGDDHRESNPNCNTKGEHVMHHGHEQMHP